jgi:hypothetical protein
MKQFNDENNGNKGSSWFPSFGTTFSNILNWGVLPKQVNPLCDLMEVNKDQRRHSDAAPLWQKIMAEYFTYLPTSVAGEEAVAPMMHNNIDAIYNLLTIDGKPIKENGVYTFKQDVHLSIEVHLNVLEYVQAHYSKEFADLIFKEAKLVLKDQYPQFALDDILEAYNSFSDDDYQSTDTTGSDNDSGSEIGEMEISALQNDVKTEPTTFTLFSQFDNISDGYHSESDENYYSADNSAETGSISDDDDISDIEIEGLEKDLKTSPATSYSKKL